jgi:HTH-type transcriptional regulator/antitoxin HipB
MTFVSEYVVRDWARIGAIVREHRRQAGLTQAALAQRAGVSRGWLVKLEAGHSTADTPTVFKVLRALDLEIVARPTRRTEAEAAAERALAELLGDA